MTATYVFRQCTSFSSNNNAIAYGACASHHRSRDFPKKRLRNGKACFQGPR